MIRTNLVQLWHIIQAVDPSLILTMLSRDPDRPISWCPCPSLVFFRPTLEDLRYRHHRLLPIRWNNFEFQKIAMWPKILLEKKNFTFYSEARDDRTRTRLRTLVRVRSRLGHGHKNFYFGLGNEIKDFGHVVGHGLGQSHDFGHGHDFGHVHVQKPRNRTRARTYFGQACPLIFIPSNSYFDRSITLMFAFENRSSTFIPFDRPLWTWYKKWWNLRVNFPNIIIFWEII